MPTHVTFEGQLCADSAHTRDGVRQVDPKVDARLFVPIDVESFKSVESGQPLYESVIYTHECFICTERTVAARTHARTRSIQSGVGTTIEIKPIKNEDYESAEKIGNPMEARSNSLIGDRCMDR